MIKKEFWERIENTIRDCSECPVDEYAHETNEYICDHTGDCAGALMMLYERLQDEEREKQEMNNELPW